MSLVKSPSAHHFSAMRCGRDRLYGLGHLHLQKCRYRCINSPLLFLMDYFLHLFKSVLFITQKQAISSALIPSLKVIDVACSWPCIKWSGSVLYLLPSFAWLCFSLSHTHTHYKSRFTWLLGKFPMKKLAVSCTMVTLQHEQSLHWRPDDSKCQRRSCLLEGGPASRAHSLRSTGRASITLYGHCTCTVPLPLMGAYCIHMSEGGEKRLAKLLCLLRNV